MATHNSMSKSQKYVAQKKPDTQIICIKYGFIYMQFGKGKFSK